jgi:hypothetical protein
MADNKKYGLTGESRYVRGVKVYQIRALRDIGEDVKAGDLGGWIESENNLSQSGNCWIGEDGVAIDRAKVKDDAVLSAGAICDNIRLRGSAVVDTTKMISGNYVFDNIKFSGGLNSARDLPNVDTADSTFSEVVLNRTKSEYDIEIHSIMHSLSDEVNYTVYTGTIGDKPFTYAPGRHMYDADREDLEFEYVRIKDGISFGSEWDYKKLCRAYRLDLDDGYHIDDAPKQVLKNAVEAEILPDIKMAVKDAEKQINKKNYGVETKSVRWQGYINCVFVKNDAEELTREKFDEIFNSSKVSYSQATAEYHDKSYKDAPNPNYKEGLRAEYLNGDLIDKIKSSIHNGNTSGYLNLGDGLELKWHMKIQSCVSEPLTKYVDSIKNGIKMDFPLLDEDAKHKIVNDIVGDTFSRNKDRRNCSDGEVSTVYMYYQFPKREKAPALHIVNQQENNNNRGRSR